MNSIPKVSVVIPTYNRPLLIQRAIRSVRAQTFQDFEIIVVDDGLRERAEASVLSFGDERIRYVQNETSIGGGATRNRGIRLARAEFVAFLDDDDEWLPRKLEVQLNTLEKSEERIGFIFCAVENIYADRIEVTEVDPDIRDYSIRALTRFKGFLTSGLVVKKTVFDEVGVFDESLPSHQEADLILRVSQKYHGIGLKEPYVRMQMSREDEHIGGDMRKRIRGREMVLAKHRALLEKHPALLAKHYYWLGLWYREVGEWRLYGRACMQSLRYDFSTYVLGHAVIGYIVMIGMGVKKFLLDGIFRPMHVGLMIRFMYARTYIPHFVFTKEGVAILDAGCGRGRYSELIASRNPHAQIYGIDVSHEKEWETYPYTNVSFGVQDLHTYNEHEVRDFIISVDVLEHIRDNRLVLERFARGLKKGGYVYIAVPCDATAVHIFPRAWFQRFHEWEEDEHVGEQHTLTEWKVLCESYGLTVETARHTFTWWGTLAWEIQFLLHQHGWGRRLNVLLMPFYRTLAYLDIYLPIGTGNNLIIAKK